MKVKLLVIGGKKDGMEIPISTPKFLIGRGDRCHIRPQNDLVGELHCLISIDGNSVTLEDCGGAIGTFVNGKKVEQRCRLQNNDRIKIAAMEFVVQLIADEREAQQPVPKTEEADDGRAVDTLQWVKQEEKVRSSPREIVTVQHVMPEKEDHGAAATAKPREADDYASGFRWELTDLWLLLTIVPLVGVLLSFLPTFWIWRSVGGILLGVLGWVFRTRTKRARIIKLDELNVAIGVLAMLVVDLMLPSYWVWLGGNALLLVALSVVVGIRIKRMVGDKLDDTNVAWSAAIALLTYIVTNQLLSTVPGGWLGGAIRWLSAKEWPRVGGAIVPLVAIAALFGIRANRMTGNKLDGLSLLLLSQIGILAFSALHLVLPNLGVWQAGAVLLLVVLIPLLFIRMARIDGRTLNEINLALLVQIGLLVLFIASQWLPYYWVQIIAGTILAAALIPLLGIRMAWKKERKLTEVDLALLVQIGMFAFVIGNRWLPAFWVPIGEGVILLAALAMVFWLHQKCLTGRKSDEVMLRLAAVGILLVVILGFLFPITSWWPA